MKTNHDKYYNSFLNSIIIPSVEKKIAFVLEFVDKIFVHVQYGVMVMVFNATFNNISVIS